MDSGPESCNSLGVAQVTADCECCDAIRTASVAVLCPRPSTPSRWNRILRHIVGKTSGAVVTNCRSNVHCSDSFPHAAWAKFSANPMTLPYNGFQSPAAGPASGTVSPESHDAIATINAWS